MNEELSYGQREELRQQRIGFRYIHNEVVGLKKYIDVEKILQYYDTETKCWCKIPTQTNFVYVKQ